MKYYFTKENLTFKSYDRSDDEMLVFTNRLEDLLFKNGLVKGFTSSAAVSLAFEMCERISGAEDAEKTFAAFLERASNFIDKLASGRLAVGDKVIGEITGVRFGENTVIAYTKDGSFEF